ncbi:MAG: hypothetical protein ABSD70_06085 [Terracidiphilus sp.]|jgi:hypothetical protein
MNGRIRVIWALLLAAPLLPAASAQTTPQASPVRRTAPSGAVPAAPLPAASSPATSSASAPNAASGAANPAAAGSANPLASNDCDGEPCPGPTPHITIATPAPAPAPWPWQERIAWAANIILLIIAYVGILAAVSTLRKIERQTRYAEAAAQAATDSAKAALQFAQAHVRAERPWILVSTEPVPGTPDTYSVVATNRGRGLARIASLSDGIAITKDESTLPPDPAYHDSDPAAPPASMVLLPGESITIRSFRREDVRATCATPDQLRRVENWDEKIFLFGKVVYVDLQSPDEKQPFVTAWCCWYIHGRQKSGMVMANNRLYNQHT